MKQLSDNQLTERGTQYLQHTPIRKDVIFEDYRDSHPARVAKFFINRGYSVSDESGLSREPDSKLELERLKTTMGILKPRSGNFFRKRRELIAIVQHATWPDGGLSKKWEFRIYGRENIPEVRVLAISAGEFFNMEPSLELVREGRRQESYSGDWMP